MLQWRRHHFIRFAGFLLILGGLHFTLFDLVGRFVAQAEIDDSSNRPSSFAETARLDPQDGASLDQFGWAVAIDGDHAIVGANRDDGYRGSAYIFVRNGSTWTQQQKLVALDGSVDDNFGWSVAIDGDIAVVGSFLDDSPVTDQGSVYVFVRNGESWSQQQKLVAGDGAANDQFGGSVSVSGDTLAVGAAGSSSSRGAAYVFVRSGSSWIQQQKLTAVDGIANEEFGTSVSIDGDTLVVGSPGDEAARGTAFVFSQSAGTWSFQQKITATDGSPLDQFGASLDISASTIAVGSVNNMTGGAGRGAVYVYTSENGSWVQQQKLAAPDGDGNDQYGGSVGISGNRIIVGACGDDIGSGSDVGSAYVYSRNGSAWTLSQKLTPANGSEGDFLGNSVAIDGRYTIIGSYLDDVAAADSGSAYIFDDPDLAGPTPTPTPAGIEGDVAGRPQGDGTLLANDVVQLRRFIVGNDVVAATTNEFQRADAAPIASLGDGILDAADIAQNRRDILRLDVVRPAGGPVQPVGGPGSVKWLTDDPYRFMSQVQLKVPEIDASPGDRVTIPILLEGGSDVSALSFTLVYPSRILSNPSIRLSDASPSGPTLTTNSNEAELGRIGLLVDSDRPFEAPFGVLLELEFDVRTTSRVGRSAIRITSDIAYIRASDPSGTSVPARIYDGSITIRPKFSRGRQQISPH